MKSYKTYEHDMHSTVNNLPGAHVWPTFKNSVMIGPQLVSLQNKISHIGVHELRVKIVYTLSLMHISLSLLLKTQCYIDDFKISSRASSHEARS